MTGKRLQSAIFRFPLPVVSWLLATLAPAIAHTSESGFVLLLPTGYYLAGGTLAVLVSFFLVFLLPAQALERVTAARWRLGQIRLPSILVTSTISFLILLVLLFAGFLGSRDPRANPLPLAIWSLWWVGFTFLQALLGDLWHRVNPWVAPYRLILRVMNLAQLDHFLMRHPRAKTRGSIGAVERVDARVKPGHDELGVPASPLPTQPPLRYPDWLGFWPTILGFGCFAWFELVDLAPGDPARLASAILLYGAITLTGMVLFGGEIWLRRADPFSVFLRLIAHLSPIVAEPAGADRSSHGSNHRTLFLVPPGTRLFDLAPFPLSGVLFVLLTLSTVSFDGLCKTFWWLDQGGINPLEFPGRSTVTWLNTAGLAGLWLALVAAYLLAMVLGRWINRHLPANRTAGILVVSIIPISLAYHFAHYLTVLLVDVQYAVKAAADPFDLGWNPFGIDHHHVTTSFLNDYHSVVMMWNLQAGAIVIGHLVAVAVAHVLSARLGGAGWRAPLGQLPLAALMVLYTLFGLWLLSAPNAG